MSSHVFKCDDCGATSPVYVNQRPVQLLTASHTCVETCPSCKYRRGRSANRGLCCACHRDVDIRMDYETKFWSSEDMLDTWDELRREGYSVRQASERMGVTLAALDQALYRGLLRGDPRARRPNSKVSAA